MAIRSRSRFTMGGTKGWAMPRRFSRLAFVILAAGCVSHAEWERRTGFQPAPMKPSDRVLIWSSGTVEKWHGVVITADSVSGIPYGRSLECDSCRLTIPLVRVDSMKYWTGGGVVKTSLVVAGVLAAAFVVEVVVCYIARALMPDEGACSS
jgi:hypothetical protein